jgi:RimJ/RimL family protein N-acetyltransferase
MLSFRNANIEDVYLYFDWVNDASVREQSFNNENVDFDSHCRWFENKLNDESCMMLIFFNELNINIGQIRLQKDKREEALIGISISSENRGKGYAKEMLKMATDYFLKINPSYVINAYIKVANLSSKFAFESAGFEFKKKTVYNNHNSLYYTKKLCK